jgi:hypothetical protein
MKKKLLIVAFAAQTFFSANAQQFGNRNVLNSTTHFHNSFIFEDIDADGDIDIIVTSSTGNVSSSANHVAWYKNLGNETFSAKTVISSAYNDVTTVRLLDVDEDGIKDLVVGDAATGLSWIKNMGSGFFGAKQSLQYNSYLTTFEVGDMNNDGKDDIIVAQLNGDSLHFIRNAGNGAFVYQSMFYWPNYNIYSIGFGDLDQDQVTDLIVSSGDTSPQRVIQFEYVNNAFVQTNVYASSSSPYVYKSHLYDVDNDGKMDVVTQSSDCATYWFKNFGNNAYSTLTPITVGGCMNSSMEEVGDLNGDGYMDILYKRYNVLSYRLGTGVGELSSTMLPISGTSIVGDVGRTSLFDIDGDGDLDIFYSTDDEFGWFRNNADQLSISEPTAVKFSVYPNPAGQQLNIASATGINSYAIYDATGKLIDKAILDAPETNHKINVANLSNGLYFIAIQAEAGKETLKFLKN